MCIRDRFLKAEIPLDLYKSIENNFAERLAAEEELSLIHICSKGEVGAMVNRAKTSGNDGNAVVIERQYGPYTCLLYTSEQ